MFFDEPFSALDPLIRRDMQNEVIRLHREVGKTMVFITHDLAEALKLGDHILIMREPRPEDALDGPEFPATAIIRSALHVAAGTSKPIRVVDDGRLVGIVDRAQILEAVAGGAEDLAASAAPSVVI